MISIISTIVIIAAVLFILSFFMKDRVKEVEKQVEQVSLTMMQNNYQMKKKMKVLEEELLSDHIVEDKAPRPASPRPSAPVPEDLPAEETVLHMYRKGYKTHYIAKQTKLSEHTVESLIEEEKAAGVKQ
ncbi:response regulator transcription factor [Halobacillus sp. ACCC02827]|uniref:response regulator transcription factor n=1 Tax=Bacillaceae TaxID=186817 RepID=UPI0002A4D874|nr:MULTISPECIES: response regulator transcription factor [Bacillaceae]ELK46212.1 hypothetical protein D479_11386 [Halobacillus sp. BAB-2008]WJE14396.1 response regulator transcription factor [Halobacillus sp. ACCC02827]